MSNEELVKQIQQGINIDHGMEELYKNNRPLIYQIAKKYMGYSDIDDLMQEAYFGLYEAVQRYEDSHEVKFMSYAGYWITQTIKRYVDNYCRTVRLPVGMQSRMYQYKKIINAYESRLHRKPTDEELCRHLLIESKLLGELKKAILQYNRLESLDEPINGSEDDDMLLGDSISDKSKLEDEIIDSMLQNELKTELWEIVKDNTTEEENKVIDARYKRNLSLEATGQCIGQSRDRARSIEAKALRKLRRPKVRRELEEKFEVNYARVYRGSLTSFNNDWTSIVESIALKNIEIERMI